LRDDGDRDDDDIRQAIAAATAARVPAWARPSWTNCSDACD
jgi:hypothetical protein